MSAMDEREKGYERKFSLDQETLFKVKARRNRLLGNWVAAQLGLSGAAADDYAKEVVAADFERPGDEDVVEKVLRDTQAKGLSITAPDIRRELERFFGQARTEISPQ